MNTKLLPNCLFEQIFERTLSKPPNGTNGLLFYFSELFSSIVISLVGNYVVCALNDQPLASKALELDTKGFLNWFWVQFDKMNFVKKYIQFDVDCA